MVSKEEYEQFLHNLINKNDSEEIKQKTANNKPFDISLRFVAPFFVLAVILLFISFSLFPVFSPVFIFIFIGLFVALIILIIKKYKISKEVKNFESKYKEQIIDFLLKENFYAYSPKGFISEKEFVSHKIFSSNIDDYTGEDKLVLNIPNDDGTDSENFFVLSDIHATRTERDSDGDTHTVTVYSGIYGYIKFPFEFKNSLCVNIKYSYAKKRLEKIKLEDINFNKNFKIYCDDQVEARYILTVKMMQQLEVLKNIFGKFFIVMAGNSLYIGFPGRNLFDYKYKEGIHEGFYNFYDDINVLLEIVKEIQTNNKIFKI